jgi:hypothetical protein
LNWNTEETVPFPTPIKDIHQIYWFDGVLYATHTAANRLDTWDDRGFGTIRWCGEGADEHINSIWCDGERFYVCEHRRGVEPARVRVFDRGWNPVGTQEFYGLNPAHACGVHNVYVEGGVLYTLSVDRLVLRNLASGETETRVVRDAAHLDYLRGFARSADRFVVGKSQVGVKEVRGEGDAEILFLDENLRLEDVIVLPDAGQLHDIRLLEGDRAHNGLDCPVNFDGP